MSISIATSTAIEGGLLPSRREKIIRILWEKQFEGSPWETKFHLMRPDSLEADYGALADKILAVARTNPPPVQPSDGVSLHFWEYGDCDGDPRLDGKPYTVYMVNHREPKDEQDGTEISKELWDALRATPPAPQPSEAEREAIAQILYSYAGHSIDTEQAIDTILARRSAPSEAEIIERCAKIAQDHFADMGSHSNYCHAGAIIASAIRSLKGNGSEKT